MAFLRLEKRPHFNYACGDSDTVVDEENLPWISAVHDWSNCVLVPAQPLVHCTLLKHEDDDNI